MEWSTAFDLLDSARSCVKDIRDEEYFLTLWNICCSQCARCNSNSNWKRAANSQLTDFVREMHGQQEPNENADFKRLFPNATDVVLNEMNDRFSNCNSDVM